MANCHEQNLQNISLVLDHDSFNVLELFFYIQYLKFTFNEIQTYMWIITDTAEVEPYLNILAFKKTPNFQVHFFCDSLNCFQRCLHMDLNHGPESSTWASFWQVSLMKSRQINAKPCHCSHCWHCSYLKRRQIKGISWRIQFLWCVKADFLKPFSG